LLFQPCKHSKLAVKLATREATLCQNILIFLQLSQICFRILSRQSENFSIFSKVFSQITFRNTIVPLNRYQSHHPACAQAPLPLPNMLFWQDKSLQNPFPAPHFKCRILLKCFRFPQVLTRGISFLWGDQVTSDGQEKLRTGGGVCKNLSFSRYFQHKWHNLHSKVSQMHRAGTEKQRTHFTWAFDNHEIMVVETFSAFNTLMFIKISEY